MTNNEFEALSMEEKRAHNVKVAKLATQIREMDPATKALVLRFVELLLLARESPEAEAAVDAALLYATGQTNQANT